MDVTSTWNWNSIGGLLFLASLHLEGYLRKCKPAIVNFSKKRASSRVDRMKRIVNSCPLIKETFLPPFFFSNRHLQMLPFMIRNAFREIFPKFTWIREELQLSDGEVVLVEWANRQPQSGSEDCTPVLIINHGATGHTRDQPGQSNVQSALDKGWFVCVFNRRGHGGMRLTKPKFNLFGFTEDLREVIVKCVRKKMPRARVFLIGLSAGSGLVARYMGEQGLSDRSLDDIRVEGDGDQSISDGDDYIVAPIGNFDGAVGINPGYNIEECMSRFGFPYSGYVLDAVKSFFLLSNQDVLKDCAGYKECLDANNLQEWLDKSYGMGGYDSTLAYYDATNPMRVACHIKHPTLMINSRDDPLCIISNAHEGFYIFENSAEGACVIETETGTHCSFLELGMQSSYSSRVAFEFFESVLKNN